MSLLKSTGRKRLRDTITPRDGFDASTVFVQSVHMMRSIRMGLLFLTASASIVFPSSATAQAAPANDVLFEQLRDNDMDVRIAALRELQTSLDPRLPEALLILLKDEGNTTRRLAARGIGSRYWQIPEERIPVYIKALRGNLNADPETRGGMVSRAIALLTREYKSPEVSRSANGRWVLYERYGHPCLIDTQNGTEELLGWQLGLHLDFYNHQIEEEGGFTAWHTDKDIVAMIVELDRRRTTAWAWILQRGLIKLDHDKVISALGYKHTISGGGFYVEHVGWDETKIRLECKFVAIQNPEALTQGEQPKYDDVSAVVIWDPFTGGIAKAP